MPQEPLVTKDHVVLQDFQAKLVLMVSLEPLVFPDVLERKDLRECRAHQDLQENQDHLAWLDLQVPLVDRENVEREETQDRKAFPDHKDREELLELQVLREKREPLAPREKKV